MDPKNIKQFSVNMNKKPKYQIKLQNSCYQWFGDVNINIHTILHL